MLSQNLRRWRKTRALSQAALAKASGLTQAAISQMEQGRRTPTLASLTRLAHGLNVPLSEFLQPSVERSLSRYQIDRMARFVIWETSPTYRGGPSLEEQGLARRVGSLAIQKLRAHQATGRKKYARTRWQTVRRAQEIKQQLGEKAVQQILHRIDTLLAMGVR